MFYMHSSEAAGSAPMKYHPGAGFDWPVDKQLHRQVGRQGRQDGDWDGIGRDV